MTAIEFLRKTSEGDGYRIVSSNDLTHLQISEAQRLRLFFVDEETGFGWALVPWELTTTKDRKREADYFSRNNMMA